jgi:hypothetical protein
MGQFTLARLRQLLILVAAFAPRKRDSDLQDFPVTTNLAIPDRLPFHKGKESGIVATFGVSFAFRRRTFIFGPLLNVQILARLKTTLSTWFPSRYPDIAKLSPSISGC